MKQLVEPNLSVKGQVGWCLSYVKEVFNTPVVYPSAWDAWEATKFKHTDALPTDVAVPVFFSYFTTINGVYKDWGHVVVSVPGRGFYSSPWKSSQSFAVLGSIAEVEHIYGVKYVGWAEDVNKVKVVGESMGNWNNGDTYNLLFHACNAGIAKRAQDANYVGYFGLQDGMDAKKAFNDIISSPQFDFLVDEARKAILQDTNGDMEANMVGKALIKLMQTFGYKKGA